MPLGHLRSLLGEGIIRLGMALYDLGIRVGGKPRLG